MIVLIKFFGFLADPKMQDRVKEFNNLRGHLKCMAILIVFTFYLRGFVFCSLGNMYRVIQTPFWRFELYFLITLLIEAPNIFYLYVMHLRCFKEQNSGFIESG